MLFVLELQSLETPIVESRHDRSNVSPMMCFSTLSPVMCVEPPHVPSQQEPSTIDH